MEPDKKNVLTALPAVLEKEFFETLIEGEHVRVERIVSRGHTSPDQGWYDQEDHEWVLVLKGGGEITFERGDVVRLGPGDHLNIPAHTRHKVTWTEPDKETLWLAVFYC